MKHYQFFFYKDKCNLNASYINFKKPSRKLLSAKMNNTFQKFVEENLAETPSIKYKPSTNSKFLGFLFLASAMYSSISV